MLVMCYIVYGVNPVLKAIRVSGYHHAIKMSDWGDLHASKHPHGRATHPYQSPYTDLGLKQE